MSKICDRNYQNNAMYSVKQIDGMACCPICEQPAVCHGKSSEVRTVFWFLTGNTGISSKAIAKHMNGITAKSYLGSLPPLDKSDRLRCIKLLELIPEWIPRLDEMKRYDAKKQEGIVINNSGISAYNNSWSKQIPLIVSEGNFARPSN